MTTTELAVPETVDGELVSPAEPLSESGAKVLDRKIRNASARVLDNMDALLVLIEQAAAGQIWVALGLPSMSAYLKESVTVFPTDRVERKALSEALAGKGFSNRTTAAILRVDEKTVRRDTENTPRGETVEGVNGATYQSSKPPAKKPKPKKDIIDAEVIPPKPQPVSQDFADEMGYLANSVSSFKDILGDERFPKAVRTIGKRFGTKLAEHIAALNTVAEAIAG